MNRYFAAALAVITLTTQGLTTHAVYAADIPLKAPPPSAPAFSWTGLYIGAMAGSGHGSTQHVNVSNGVSSVQSSISGALYGLTYGYNWQIGPLVVGFEGDIAGSNITRRFGNNSFCGGTIPCVTDLLWMGTARARAGLTWYQVLFYATAGVAYGTVQGQILDTTHPPGNSTRSGFIYGGGIEYAFAPSWSIKLEYLRTDLGDKVTYVGVESVSLKQLEMVRGGINYRFNFP